MVVCEGQSRNQRSPVLLCFTNPLFICAARWMQPWHRRSAIWPGCSRTAMRTPPTNSLSRCRTKELLVNISFRRTPTPHSPTQSIHLQFPTPLRGKKICEHTTLYLQIGQTRVPCFHLHITVTRKNFIVFVVLTNRHPVEDLYEVTVVAAETRNMQFNSQSLPHRSNCLFHFPSNRPTHSRSPTLRWQLCCVWWHGGS